MTALYNFANRFNAFSMVTPREINYSDFRAAYAEHGGTLPKVTMGAWDTQQELQRSLRSIPDFDWQPWADFETVDGEKTICLASPANHGVAMMWLLTKDPEGMWGWGSGGGKRINVVGSVRSASYADTAGVKALKAAGFALPATIPYHCLDAYEALNFLHTTRKDIWP